MTRDSGTRTNFIKWYKEVFGFSNEVATALHDDQLFKDALTIANFGDSEIDSVCRTLRRDSSLPIAELAVTRLKLMTFWVRHQHHTDRAIGGTSNPLVRIELKDLNLLKELKRLEDGWAANNKEPEYTAIALDLTSAAKAFKKVKTSLTHIRGVLGAPLVYVIRHQLVPEYERDDLAFGDDDNTNGTPTYTSHDQEMISQCPILTDACDFTRSSDELEAHDLLYKPFVLLQSVRYVCMVSCV
jgi:hypothetical protein